MLRSAESHLRAAQANPDSQEGKHTNIVLPMRAVSGNRESW